MSATHPSTASRSAEKAATLDPAQSERPGAAHSRRTHLRSESLFAGATELEIQHGEAIYRLRITSLGKLILTK